MSKQLMFDTLDYAKVLEKGGVAHADTHSEALADAIGQNIYSKGEMDTKLEALLKPTNESIHRLELKIQAVELEIKATEVRLQKSISRHTYATISILGSLIVVVGAISTFAHSFIH